VEGIQNPSERNQSKPEQNQSFAERNPNPAERNPNPTSFYEFSLFNHLSPILAGTLCKYLFAALPAGATPVRPTARTNSEREPHPFVKKMSIFEKSRPRVAFV